MSSSRLPAASWSLRLAVLLVLLCGMAPAARAGLTVAASVGVGGQIAPEAHYQATNLLIAPGFDFLGFVRPELGFVGTLEQIRGGDVLNVGWELRPMLVFGAPLLPLYGRLVFAFVDPFSDENRAWAYGGSLGVSVALVGLSLFAEAGVLPRSTNAAFSWVMEGRAGATLGF